MIKATNPACHTHQRLSPGLRGGLGKTNQYTMLKKGNELSKEKVLLKEKEMDKVEEWSPG